MIRYATIPALLAAGLFVTNASAQQFTLCEGEYSEPNKGSPCAKDQAYAYCGTAAAEVDRICKASGASGTPSMVVIRNIGGNKCGYAFWNVTCK
jgi:hypothetical protein